MWKLLTLIASLFSTPNIEAIPVQPLVEAVQEVDVQDMYAYLGTVNDGEEVVVDDKQCLEVLDMLTPIIWDSMGLGDVGTLSAVDASRSGITYHFEDGTETSFDFEELLKMLE